MTTTNKGLNQPAEGSLNWGPPLNDNADLLDRALGSAATINVTGAASPVTLTAADYVNMALIFTGTLVGNVTYRVPSGVAGQWVVINQTSGAFSLIIASAAGGPTVTIPASARISVYTDGTSGVGMVRLNDENASIPEERIAVGGASGLTSFADLNYDDETTNLQSPGARLSRTTTPSLSSTDHAFQIGATGSQNLAVGPSRLQSRNNGAAAELGLNRDGGIVSIGDNASSVILLGGLLNTGSQMLASQAEAEAGTLNTKVMSPLRVRQAILEIFEPAFVSSEITPARNLRSTIPHGLGAMPSRVDAYMVCKTADQGWSVGDRIVIGPLNYDVNSGASFNLGYNDTNILAGCAYILVQNRVSGLNFVEINYASWAIVFRAWA